MGKCTRKIIIKVNYLQINHLSIIIVNVNFIQLCCEIVLEKHAHSVGETSTLGIRLGGSPSHAYFLIIKYKYMHTI